MNRKPSDIFELSPQVVQGLIGILSECVLEKRLELFQSILEERTRYVTIVLEDIHQSQNASAAIRSCECFGIQDIHIIENDHKFSVNPKVSMGAAKWLDIYKYKQKQNNSLEAVEQLKREGYRIVGTSPHASDVSLDNFSIEKGKFALFFGNELNGLSKLVLKNASEIVKIPTVGFTESLNLSVSVAICIHKLTARLHNSTIDYRLTEREKAILLLQWLRLTVKSWRSIEKRFFAEQLYHNINE